ncbi:hypothetical protein BC833DRAFT_660523 [Globomyces pollinis-pini]|nr:hypothetical protein BC833DRAFT_660523 [Globomyces pollinis-pini]
MPCNPYVHQMKSFLSILTFLIITTIAVPQAPTALQATMPELASYKWVCREHDQVRDVSSEDTSNDSIVILNILRIRFKSILSIEPPLAEIRYWSKDNGQQSEYK